MQIFRHFRSANQEKECERKERKFYRRFRSANQNQGLHTKRTKIAASSQS